MSKMLGLALSLFFILLSAGTAQAEKLVLTLGGEQADKANFRIQIFQHSAVERRADRVMELDGSYLNIDMGDPGASIKPKSETLPNGGRVSQTPEMAAQNRVAIELPPGVYSVRIEGPDGRAFTTGLIEVKPDGVARARIDATSKIVYVDPKYGPERPENYWMYSETSSAGVRNLGTVATRENPFNFLVSLGAGYTMAGIDTKVSQNGNKTKGDDIDLSAPSIRADARFYFNGPIMAERHPGNLGNWGNVGNVGGGPRFGFWDPFFGFQGAVGIGDGSRGLRANLHPGAETDTFIKYRLAGGVTPYVGAKVADFGRGGYVRAMGGVRVNVIDIEAVTDESGGGGNRNEFNRTKVLVGPVAALEYNLPLFGGANGREPAGGLQFSTWVEHLPGTKVEGTTTPFNFDYKFETESAVAVTFRAAVFMRF